MIFLALQASRGGFAITKNVISMETIKTTATSLEDLLTDGNIDYRGATCGRM